MIFSSCFLKSLFDFYVHASFFKRQQPNVNICVLGDDELIYRKGMFFDASSILRTLRIFPVFVFSSFLSISHLLLLSISCLCIYFFFPSSTSAIISDANPSSHHLLHEMVHRIDPTNFCLPFRTRLIQFILVYRNKL